MLSPGEILALFRYMGPFCGFLLLLLAGVVLACWVGFLFTRLRPARFADGAPAPAPAPGWVRYLLTTAYDLAPLVAINGSMVAVWQAAPTGTTLQVFGLGLGSSIIGYAISMAAIPLMRHPAFVDRSGQPPE